MSEKMKTSSVSELFRSVINQITEFKEEVRKSLNDTTQQQHYNQKQFNSTIQDRMANLENKMDKMRGKHDDHLGYTVDTNFSHIKGSVDSLAIEVDKLKDVINKSTNKKEKK